MSVLNDGRRAPERGATAVEFVLVFAVLLLPFIFGGLDVLMQTFTKQEANEVARDAARVAILNYQDADVPSSANGVLLRDVVENRASSPVASVTVECLEPVQDSDVVIACSTATLDVDRIRVTAELTAPRIWSPLHNDTVTGSATMVILGLPS